MSEASGQESRKLEGRHTLIYLSCVCVFGGGTHYLVSAGAM